MIENDNAVFHVPNNVKIDELRKEINRILAIEYRVIVDEDFLMPVTHTGKIRYFND